MAHSSKSSYAYNNYNSSGRMRDSNSSVASKAKPTPKNKPQLELVKKKKKASAQARRQRVADAKRIVKTMCVATVVFLFVVLALYSRVQLDEINYEIEAVDAQMELAKSDAIRINNELAAMVSIRNVEEYAVNELGMLPVQDYQVVYIDLTGEDYVAKVNGENVDRDVNEQ